jgi:hypothetical protein
MALFAHSLKGCSRLSCPRASFRASSRCDSLLPGDPREDMIASGAAELFGQLFRIFSGSERASSDRSVSQLTFAMPSRRPGMKSSGGKKPTMR